MERKYELITDDKLQLDGNITLYRIRSLKDFGDIMKGDLGGYIESESNLSHDGDCWIYDGALAYGGSRILEDAKISGNAKIRGNAIARGNSKLYGQALMEGDAISSSNAELYERAHIRGKAFIGGNAKIYGHATIRGFNSITGNVKIYDYAIISGDTTLEGSLEICGDILISADIILRSNAKLTEHSDIFIFNNIQYGGRQFAYTLSDGIWHADCFHGTSDDFIAKAYEEGDETGRLYEHYLQFIKGMSQNIS